MRQILFKGRSHFTGNYYVGLFLGTDLFSSDISYVGFTDETKHKVQTDTVGQFTGLFTCKKERLFEKDIFNYTKHKGYLLEDFQGEVAFEDGCFGYKVITGENFKQFTPFSDIDCLQQDFLDHIELVSF